MSDGQGETPIDDIDPALPWAGIEDAPAAETPAVGEMSAHVDAATADNDDLVPLQLDETPDEEVTLVLTREEEIPLDAHEADVTDSIAADAVAAPLPESIEVSVPEQPMEVMSSDVDAPSLEVTPDPTPVADVPAVAEIQAETFEPTLAIVEEPVFISDDAPIVEVLHDSPTVVPLNLDALIVTDVVSDNTNEVASNPLEQAPSEEHSVVDFFERGEIEALHAPLDIVDHAASVDPVVAAAAEQIPAIEAPAVLVQASTETNDDFAILTPQPPTPVEHLAPAAVNVVAETEEAIDDEPDPEPVPEEEAELELVSAGAPVDEGGAGAWSIAALCLGVAVIACAVLIPQTDFNRRLVYEREKLRRDLASIEQQTKVNDEFLQRVSSDPSLAERLAQRQMKIIRKGTKVLELQNDPPEEMSPYQLVAVPPPAPLPAYEPKRGMIANVCYGVRSRLYLMGAGLMLMAAGLVFGAGPTRE